MLPTADEILERAHVVALPMAVKFRGVTTREALLIDGPAGWGDDAQERSLAAALPGRVHVLGRLSDEELAAAYRAAHEDYLRRREELGHVAEVAGISAGGMPTRVKCLHVLVAHSLAAGPGVNPLGDEALAMLPDWWAVAPRKETS